ncbi:hypothetical protein CK203_110883 [Vitis vinifera]|uniref:Uncharacterized protein n=1 Tax=Vitis vinifera TaxID=29760 RepID=A0A438FF07_VITVI|nr:hypothetical protein CK203_110883 [Vitis vinifera]
MSMTSLHDDLTSCIKIVYLCILLVQIFLEVQLDGYWPAEFGMDSTGNELALGYTIGNPITDHFSDFNSRIAYIHQVGILSDELYEVIIRPTHSGLILNRI